MKKIVINALQYKKNSSGIGVLIRDLFGAYTERSRRQCQVILPEDSPAFPAAEKTEKIKIPFSHKQGLRRIWFQSAQLGRKYCSDAVLLTTDSKIPLLLPKTCTLIPLVTDLAVFRMPQVYQASRVFLWKLQYLLMRRRADYYLAISEFTRQEMVKLLNIPEEKISVVPCACNPWYAPVAREAAHQQLSSRYALPERYILFVGNSNPRKNLERLIKAFDMAREQGGISQHLVISGELGWKFSQEEALAGVKHKNAIHFVGFVPDEDMPALYSLADLFAFPTLYEGFGIPVIEAQQCGTPVLTSNCSSLPEVGGNAAVYADPYDVEEICKGMLTVLSDTQLAQQLVENGFKNAKRYSWETSAELLNEIIEEIVQ